MKQVDKISVAELKKMSENMFDGLVKAVVDIEKRLVVVDAEMHFDEEQFLLEGGSQQVNLWGINLYPENYGKADFLEYDSMINIRPNHGNRSRGVDDPTIRKTIEEIIGEVVHA
jgi:hypothetical protein